MDPSNNNAEEKAITTNPTAINVYGDLEEALLAPPSSAPPSDANHTSHPQVQQQYTNQHPTLTTNTLEEGTVPRSVSISSDHSSPPLLVLSISDKDFEKNQPSDDVRSSSLPSIPPPIDEPTLDQIQEDHLLEVTTRKKGLHVGTLRDGWKPYDPKVAKTSWYVRECLNGLAISFSQIPESIFFSKLAHVSPALGLRSSWIVGLICAVIGGRPAMINGSSGAYAMMIATFVSLPLDQYGNGEGIEYLFPSVIFAGILNILFSFMNIGDGLLTLMSTTIVIAFCNSLAIFMANPLFTYEFPDKTNRIQVLCIIIMAIVGMMAIEFTPWLRRKSRIFKLIPGALLAILCSSFIEYCIVRPLGYKTPLVQDKSPLKADEVIPLPFFVNTQFDMTKLMMDKNGWMKILHQGYMLAAIGTVESMLTMKIVDANTSTLGWGNRQEFAVGFANVVAGFLGGMGGTAMIGLSTINTLNGSRGRISSMVAALSCMVWITFGYNILNHIPVTVLQVIMIKKCLMTFKWFTIDMIIFCFVPSRWITRLGLPARKVNRTDVLIIVSVMLISIHQIAPWGNLFYAVVIGIGASIIIFIIRVLSHGGSIRYIWRAFVSHPAIFLSKKRLDEDGTMIYVVRGPLFFATVRTFVTLFEPEKETATNVIIYMEDGRIYDYSSLEGLSKVCKSFKTAGKFVNVMGLTESSKKMIRVSDGSANRCTWCPWGKKFSLGWILGDIEIAGEEVHKDKNAVILKDMESMPSVDEFSRGNKFLVSASPESYVFT